MKKQAAFFFGSGISFPSGMPSVGKLTSDAIECDWHLHTDSNFYPGFAPGNAGLDATTSAVRAFLLKVNDCAADYIADIARFGTTRSPLYEDWFSLLAQAAQ